MVIATRPAARDGSILIVVLFVMSVLSLTALSLAYRAGTGFKTCRDATVMRRLGCHVDSAMAIALARLAENANAYDHPAESWHTHRSLSQDSWLPEWTGGRFEEPEFVTEYYVADEEGKLNVLYASGEDLKALGLSREQIAAIFDWMDADDVARAEGAESAYYRGRAMPYVAKNAPIETIEELLLIRGITPSAFYGEDANRNGLLDANERDGGLTAPDDNGDTTCNAGLVDLLTCYGDGRININTAGEAVLKTLPISAAAVQQILLYRTVYASSSLDDHVFQSCADIGELQGIPDTDAEALEGLVAFRSTHFRIHVQATHTPTGLTRQAQAVVRSDGGLVEIIQYGATP